MICLTRFKSLWYRCFPVNFTKFLRTPFLQNTSVRLVLHEAHSYLDYNQRDFFWILSQVITSENIQSFTSFIQTPSRTFLLHVVNTQNQYIEQSRILQRNSKDTHREKALSNKITVLTKNTNIGIWVVGTTNQLFIKNS